MAPREGVEAREQAVDEAPRPGGHLGEHRLAQAVLDPALPCLELAAREAALRNPRLATPAYDPLSNEVRLLLPNGRHALALGVTDTGYELVAELTRADAYACARVVSSEQPRWLARGIDC